MDLVLSHWRSSGLLVYVERFGVNLIQRTPYRYVKKESKMPRKHNPKPPYPAQLRQQMIALVAAERRPSELAKEFSCHETSILS